MIMLPKMSSKMRPQAPASLPEAVNDVAPSLIALLKAARGAVDKDTEVAKSSLAQACSLLQIAMERDASEPDSVTGGLASWQIKRLNRHLDEHIDQPIRVQDLGRLIGLSSNYLNRAFKRSFGETPHSHITRRRVERAAHLLLTSDIALAEIALACGFSDQAHLCRLFRQHFGATPAMWRRERRGRPRGARSVQARRGTAAIETTRAIRPEEARS